MAEVMTVRAIVQRTKEDNIPISEYALRLWVKQGVIPARKAGRKLLIYYPNVVNYVCCNDGCENGLAGVNQ